jgi:radical SAM additional 4Fe4S-binding domain
MAKESKEHAIWEQNSQNLDELCATHPLKYLFLEITRRCNLRCVYCGSDCAPEKTKEDLSVSSWISIIRQIAEDFKAKDIMIAVTGGEPLIKPGIFDIFQELHRLRFPFGMVTNGTVIDAEMAKRVVNSGIRSISISMDAPPEINDQFRGEGVSRRVESAVKNLQQAGFKGKLEIISTLTKPAVKHLDDMRRHVAKLKVPLWRIAPVMPIGRAAANPELIPGPAELREMLEFIIQGRQDTYMPRPEFGEEGFLGDGYEGKVRPYLCQCRAGITTAGILFDGRIGACPELGDAFVQGNVLSERFRDVWDQRYQVFRDRSWTRKHECVTCAVYERCRGGSLHLYLNTQSEILRCFYKMLEEKAS